MTIPSNPSPPPPSSSSSSPPPSSSNAQDPSGAGNSVGGNVRSPQHLNPNLPPGAIPSDATESTQSADSDKSIRDQTIRYTRSANRTQTMAIKNETQKAAIDNLTKNQPNLDAYSSAKPLPLSDETFDLMLNFQLGPQAKATAKSAIDFLPGEDLDTSLYSDDVPFQSTANAATASTETTNTAETSSTEPAPNSYMAGMGTFAAATASTLLAIISGSTDYQKVLSKIQADAMLSSFSLSVFQKEKGDKAAVLTMSSKIVGGAMGIVGGSIQLGGGIASVYNSYGRESTRQLRGQVSQAEADLQSANKLVENNEKGLKKAQADFDKAVADGADTTTQKKTLDNYKKQKTTFADQQKSAQDNYNNLSNTLSNRLSNFTQQMNMLTAASSQIAQGLGGIASGSIDYFATTKQNQAQFAASQYSMYQSLYQTMVSQINNMNQTVDSALQQWASIKRSINPQG